MRAADSDAELDRRIYALGEFEKINNIAKRLSIRYASDVVSHSSLYRSKEDWLVVFRSLSRFRPRPTKDVGYPRHDSRRRSLLGRVWADGKKPCSPSGEDETHQVQKQAVHADGLSNQVLCVTLYSISSILTTRFKDISGTRVS